MQQLANSGADLRLTATPSGPGGAASRARAGRRASGGSLHRQRRKLELGRLISSVDPTLPLPAILLRQLDKVIEFVDLVVLQVRGQHLPVDHSTILGQLDELGVRRNTEVLRVELLPIILVVIEAEVSLADHPSIIAQSL